jgi:hypothetical protein
MLRQPGDLTRIFGGLRASPCLVGYICRADGRYVAATARLSSSSSEGAHGDLWSCPPLDPGLSLTCDRGFRRRDTAYRAPGKGGYAILPVWTPSGLPMKLLGDARVE